MHRFPPRIAAVCGAFWPVPLPPVRLSSPPQQRRRWSSRWSADPPASLSSQDQRFTQAIPLRRAHLLVASVSCHSRPASS